MKKIRITIVSLSLAMALNIVVGCGKNPTSNKQSFPSGIPSTSQSFPSGMPSTSQSFPSGMPSTSQSFPSGMPSTPQSSPSGMPSTPQSSPEEVLAAAKQQVDELLAHPEKADEWRNNSFKVLQDNMNKRHAGWSPAERSKLLLAAQAATNCASAYIRESQKRNQNVATILQQALDCAINYGRAFKGGYARYPFSEGTVDGKRKSFQAMYDELITMPQQYIDAIPDTLPYKEQKNQVYLNFPNIRSFLQLTVSCILEKKYNKCIDSNNVDLGIKAIVKEAKQILDDTINIDTDTVQGYEKFIRDFTRISILLVEAVKAEFLGLAS